MKMEQNINDINIKKKSIEPKMINLLTKVNN